MDTHNDPTTSQANTHKPNELDRADYQVVDGRIVRRQRLTSWADRARAGVLVAKDMTGGAR